MLIRQFEHVRLSTQQDNDLQVQTAGGNLTVLVTLVSGIVPFT